MSVPRWKEHFAADIAMFEVTWLATPIIMQNFSLMLKSQQINQEISKYFITK